MKKVLINSLGWSEAEKASFKSYLSDLAEEFGCYIRVLEGVDSKIDMLVETDDESIVYMIVSQGLSE